MLTDRSQEHKEHITFARKSSVELLEVRQVAGDEEHHAAIKGVCAPQMKPQDGYVHKR